MLSKLTNLVKKALRHRRQATLAVTVRRYLLERVGMTTFPAPRFGHELFSRASSVAVFLLACLLVAPLAAGVGFALCVSDLYSPRARRRPVPAMSGSGQIGSVEIIVLTWNGADLLRKCLPSVVDAASRSPVPATVMVVDNGSIDDTITMLATSFPAVRVLQLPENFGFVVGNNRGVEASLADVVLLLNNDMLVDKDFVAPLIEALYHPDTFASTSQIIMREGVRREETGLTTGAFQFGRFQVVHAPIAGDAVIDQTPVLYAGGGSMAVRRDQFLSMGGFCALYRPIYWEDVDLSYRARKGGFQVLLASQSKVLHLHRSTMSRFPAAKVQRIVRRNEYLFIWANMHDSRWLASHLVLLPLHMVRELRADGPAVAVGAFLMAVARLHEALTARIDARRHSTMTDRAVVGRFEPRGIG